MAFLRALCFTGVACVVAFAARADENFRCGKWVISRELTLGEIIAHCGPPQSRVSRVEEVRRRAETGYTVKVGTQTIETLTWRRSPGALPMVVTVVDGAVKSVERQP